MRTKGFFHVEDEIDDELNSQEFENKSKSRSKGQKVYEETASKYICSSFH